MLLVHQHLTLILEAINNLHLFSIGQRLFPNSNIAAQKKEKP